MSEEKLREIINENIESEYRLLNFDMKYTLANCLVKDIMRWHKEQVKDECRKLVPEKKALPNNYNRELDISESRKEGFNIAIDTMHDNINKLG